jgi:hypothetical protein
VSCGQDPGLSPDILRTPASIHEQPENQTEVMEMTRVGVFVGSLLLIAGLSAMPAFSQNPDQHMDQTANQIAQREAGHEPHMAAALEHLRQAADELEKATRNKGGHREKALQLTHQAMSQVEQGVKYYDQHPPKK